MKMKVLPNSLVGKKGEKPKRGLKKLGVEKKGCTCPYLWKGKATKIGGVVRWAGKIPVKAGKTF